MARIRPLLLTDRIDPADPIDRMDPALPMDATHPADPIDATEPALPIEAMLPALPIDRTEPTEPTERIEDPEPMDVIEDHGHGVSFACRAWLIDVGSRRRRAHILPAAARLRPMRTGGVRWWFEHRETGKITIAQFPNRPLVLALVGILGSRLVNGGLAEALRWLGTSGIAWWAIDEVVRREPMAAVPWAFDHWLGARRHAWVNPNTAVGPLSLVCMTLSLRSRS